MYTITMDHVSVDAIINHTFKVARILQAANVSDLAHFHDSQARAAQEQFVSSIDQAGLFIIKHENGFTITFDSVNTPQNIISLVAFVKGKGAVAELSQLQVIHLSEGQIDVGLGSLVKMGVSPLFDNLSGVEGVKKKINELALSLQNMQGTVQVPDLVMTAHPVIKELAKQPNPVIDDSFTENTPLLNELQKCVNEWMKLVKNITDLKHTPAEGTAMHEIHYWQSIEMSSQFKKAHINKLAEKRSGTLFENKLPIC